MKMQTTIRSRVLALIVSLTLTITPAAFMIHTDVASAAVTAEANEADIQSETDIRLDKNLQIKENAQKNCLQQEVHRKAQNKAQNEAQNEAMQKNSLSEKSVNKTDANTLNNKMTAGDPANPINGKFSYVSGITDNIEKYDFSFDETWFNNSAEEYNHNLARMSIRMSLAAGGVVRGIGSDSISSYDIEDSKNITTLFNDIGLNNTVVSYPEPYFSKEKSTIGYAIGSKKINDNDTLIVVAVRGSRYKAEWGDNFYIGDSDKHLGFHRAGNTVTNAVKDYIEKNKGTITGNIKIWIAGHSRGGVVANITAHNLNALADEKTITGLNKNGIFAYCFENPRSVRIDRNDLKEHPEGNIKNIIFDMDLITKVMPKQWGFDRYGVNYYLPALRYTSNYKEEREKLKLAYKKIITETSIKREKIEETAENLTKYADFQASLAEAMVNDAVSFVKSQNNYVKNYEDEVTIFVAKYFSGGEIDISAFIEKILTKYRGFFDLHKDTVSRFLDNRMSIRRSHFPDTSLAWMDAIEGEQDYVAGKTRRIIINGSVNVYVEQNGKQIAEITDSKADSGEHEIECFVDEKDQKIVGLPFDDEYDIKIESKTGGDVSYQVEEIDDEYFDPDRFISYLDLKMDKDDVFTGKAGKADIEGKAEYILKDNDKQALEPSADVSKDTVTYCDVDLDIRGKGYAAGHGNYKKNEYVKLIAEPESDSEFDCWMQNGKILSRENKYKFRITENADITAVFNEIKEIASIKLDKKSFVYTGKNIVPKTVVKDIKGKILRKGTDYNILCKNNKNVGTAVITVTGIKGCEGKVSKAFTIVPKGAAVKKSKAGKKSFTARWYRQSKKMSKSHITGYQVQYKKAGKKYSKIRNVTVNGYKKTSKKITGLAKNKKYTVRVRTFMKIGNKKYYSLWSKSKSIKTR